MRDKMDGAQRTGEAVLTFQVLMLKPQLNKTVGTYRHNWEVNIKIYLAKIYLYGCKSCVHGVGPSLSLLAYFYEYSRTPFIRINLDSELSGYAENPDNWIFLRK
jgi:hypothetical protein